jgi:hypothetical protein
VQLKDILGEINPQCRDVYSGPSFSYVP